MRYVFKATVLMLIICALSEAEPEIEFTDFNLDFTGEAFFYNTIAQEKNTNSADYNTLKIENVKNNIFLNLRFFNNRRNIAGFASFNFNTDYSYYSFYIYRAFLTYTIDAGKIQIFYRDRILNFDNGLRLLDEDVWTLYQPIIFYKKPVERFAYFGKEYYGIYFNIQKRNLFQRICFASSYRDSHLKYLVANKTEYRVAPVLISGNIIYKQQDYTVPEVNQNNWAEIDGIWYEFNPNSFYDPDEPDYEIKATGELGFNLRDVLKLWGETGIKRKSGGYYAQMTAKATSSGNVPVDIALSSPAWDYFVTAAGLQIDFYPFLIETEYKLYNGEELGFNFDKALNQLFIYTNRPQYSEIKLKLRYQQNIFKLNFAIWVGKTPKDTIKMYLDEYNFVNRYYIYCTQLKGIKTYNRIDLKLFNLVPELEYREYSSENYYAETSEIQGGVEFELKRIKSFINIRYKKYIFEDKTYNIAHADDFINIFAGVSYRINNFISIGIDYGIDPRVLYDKDYGFEYSLLSFIEENEFEESIDEIFNAERYFSGNHFLTIHAQLRF